MIRRAELRVHDIRGAIEKIRSALSNDTFETFARDDIKIAAASMYVLIISEASRHISDDILAAHSEIPWAKIRSIGNLLRHVYFRIESEALWEIYKYDLDPLSTAVDAIAHELSNKN